MDARIFDLHKRIVKHDIKAIDEIKTLEEAKRIIEIMVNNSMLNALIHKTILRKIIKEIEEEKASDKYNYEDSWFRAGVDAGLDDAKDIVGKYTNT